MDLTRPWSAFFYLQFLYVALYKDTLLIIVNDFCACKHKLMLSIIGKLSVKSWILSYIQYDGTVV